MKKSDLYSQLCLTVIAVTLIYDCRARHSERSPTPVRIVGLAPDFINGQDSAPVQLGQATKAKIDIAKAAVLRNGSIAKALDMYKFDMVKLPDTDEGLAALFQPKEKKRDDERYNGPYMEGVFEQLKDPWGNPYEYRSPGEINEDTYDLWSRGPDGKDDGGKEGSDDVVNWVRK